MANTETDRIWDEVKRIQEKANAEAEQFHSALRELIAQKAEVAKQAAMLEKHETVLLKHDEEIAKLQFSIEQADRDIEFLNIRLDDLLESLDAATNEAQFYHNSGDAVKEERAKRKIVSLQNQIHTTESKIEKAKFNRELAERKMA